MIPDHSPALGQPARAGLLSPNISSAGSSTRGTQELFSTVSRVNPSLLGVSRARTSLARIENTQYMKPRSPLEALRTEGRERCRPLCYTLLVVARWRGPVSLQLHISVKRAHFPSQCFLFLAHRQYFHGSGGHSNGNLETAFRMSSPHPKVLTQGEFIFLVHLLRAGSSQVHLPFSTDMI